MWGGLSTEIVVNESKLTPVSSNFFLQNFSALAEFLYFKKCPFLSNHLYVCHYVPPSSKKNPPIKGFSFGIAASIRIGREIRCLQYAGFFPVL